MYMLRLHTMCTVVNGYVMKNVIAFGGFRMEGIRNELYKMVSI